jgi:hypothetical protein
MAAITKPLSWEMVAMLGDGVAKCDEWVANCENSKSRHRTP